MPSKKTSLMSAIKSLDYKNMAPVKIVSAVREMGDSVDLKDRPLTVQRVKSILIKIKVKEGLGKKKEPKKTESAPKKVTKGKRQDGIKVKKPEPFRFNEVTFGKFTTPGYECCSNMFPTAIYCLVNGEFLTFYSIEQGFQYMKTQSKEHQKKILNSIKPKDARYHGSARAECPMRDDWDEVKEDVMFELLKGKYSQNLPMAEKLLATGDVPIIEIAPWDKEGYWGVDDNRKGKNRSGKLTEKVRTWLSKRKSKGVIGYYTPELNHGE